MTINVNDLLLTARLFSTPPEVLNSDYNNTSFANSSLFSIAYNKIQGLFHRGRRDIKDPTKNSVKGIEDISRMGRNGDQSSHRQGNEQSESKTQTLEIPKGEQIDPVTLSSLKSQNNPKQTFSTMFPDLVDASPWIKLNAMMMLQAKRAKADMEWQLNQILERNGTNANLAEEIKKESEKAAETKQGAAIAENVGNISSAWGNCCEGMSKIGEHLSHIERFSNILGAVGIVASAASVTMVMGIAGAILVSVGIVCKIYAALQTKGSETMQAEIQLKKDKQNQNNTEISVLQNLFSTSSQAYNSTLSILQSMISSENEAKRTVASNIR
ncbi:MAG: hypothetical protein LBB16_03010 [Puniceicoccales bacterium]|jgi:hypothetical protein|nr:hypothetical protein [Puniceicoccales bacterium]